MELDNLKSAFLLYISATSTLTPKKVELMYKENNNFKDLDFNDAKSIDKYTKIVYSFMKKYSIT